MKMADEFSAPYRPGSGQATYLTVREHFAGMAMQGMCAGPVWPSYADMHEVAKRAVIAADALIAALAKPGASDDR